MRVWLKYPDDPSGPHAWHVYNADTGKELFDLESVVITVDATAITRIALHRLGGAVEYAILVAEPKPSSYPSCGFVIDTRPGVLPSQGSRSRSARTGVVNVNAPSKCDECSGTGQWENPVSGKRSPCSRGCKP